MPPIDWEMLLKYVSVFLSWPVIVLVIALVFRKAIKGVLQRLTKYKAFGQEAEFGQELAQAEATAERLAEEQPRPSGDEGSTDEPTQKRARSPEWEQLALLAEEGPSYVILSSWEHLRQAVEGLALKLADKPPGARTGRPSIHELARANVVRDTDVAQFEGLRRLRNQVAHGQHSPTPGEALAYADTAESVLSLVASLARHPSRSQLLDKTD